MIPIKGIQRSLGEILAGITELGITELGITELGITETGISETGITKSGTPNCRRFSFQLRRLVSFLTPCL